MKWSNFKHIFIAVLAQSSLSSSSGSDMVGCLLFISVWNVFYLLKSTVIELRIDYLAGGNGEDESLKLCEMLAGVGGNITLLLENYRGCADLPPRYALS